MIHLLVVRNPIQLTNCFDPTYLKKSRSSFKQNQRLENFLHWCSQLAPYALQRSKVKKLQPDWMPLMAWLAFVRGCQTNIPARLAGRRLSVEAGSPSVWPATAAATAPSASRWRWKKSSHSPLGGYSMMSRVFQTIDFCQVALKGVQTPGERWEIANQN